MRSWIPEFSPERNAVFWVSMFVACVTLLFHGGGIGWSDGRGMYEVTRSIVEDGEVAINKGVVWQGRDKQYYSSSGVGVSLIALVPYVLVKPVSDFTSNPEAVRQAGVAAIVPIIVALVAAALYRLSRRIGVDKDTAVILAIGSVFGTFLMVYSKDLYSEPLAILFVILSIERAIAGFPGQSGAAAAAAALTRPQLFAFAPLLLWRIQSDGGLRAVLRAIGPLIVGLMISMGYNFLRFENIFNFGYSNSEFPQGFTTPFFEGAAGLLFHPDKSIFLFSPIVALFPLALRNLWQAHRSAFWLLCGNLIITFTIASTWWDWKGGWVWGPRLLLPAVLPMVAAVGLWIDQGGFRRIVLCAVLFLGLLVNGPAMLINGGAQLMDNPPPSHGPKIFRQYELLVRAQLPYMEQRVDGTDNQPELNVWQMKTVRLMGERGVLLAASVSFLLVAIAGLALSRIGSLKAYVR